MKKLVLALMSVLLGLVLLSEASACARYDYSDAPGYGSCA